VNIDLVDGHLEELEAELLQEYMANDRPPLPSMMFVSALSQMWVFAAYELLRTWRQRAREIMLVLDPSGRQNYIDSPDADARLGLQHPRALGATQDEPPITTVSPAEAAERLDAIIQRVEAGGNR